MVQPSGSRTLLRGLGFAGSGPRCGSTHLLPSHAVVASHLQSGGGLAQMLAQGQSFPPKEKKKKSHYHKLRVGGHKVRLLINALYLWKGPKLTEKVDEK